MRASEGELSFDLRPRFSAGAALPLLLLHLAPLLLLPWVWSVGAAVLLWALALAGSWLYVRRHAALGCGPRALQRLVWHASGHWTVYDAQGASEAELLPVSLCHPRLLWLAFRRPDGARCGRLLLRGDLDAGVLRRLRARLATTSENGER